MTNFIAEVLVRLLELIQVPLIDQQMLWAAIPLLVATLFMTLYFGKYSKEQLGWNTAFGNTMVFLFVSIHLIQYMYYSEGVGSWDNVFLRPFYLTITIGLTIAAVILMLTTYYHLLPKNVAFFLFSAPPVNVSIYVLMAIVYAQVPANTITLTAAIIFFVIIFTILKGIQFLESRASSPEGLELGPKETIKEKFLGKLKEKNIELQKKKEKAE